MVFGKFFSEDPAYFCFRVCWCTHADPRGMCEFLPESYSANITFNKAEIQYRTSRKRYIGQSKRYFVSS